MLAHPGPMAIVDLVIPAIRVDDATIRALERHETCAHAIPNRVVRDLGDSIVLFDERDPDPFWNRMASIRWPTSPTAFDLRLTETIALFALRGRQPHLWPSPDHSQPADLIRRLVDHGFCDIGGGHVMVLDRPEACPPVRPEELARGVTIHTIRQVTDAGADDTHDMALVLAEAFGAMPGREVELAADLDRVLDDPRVSLAIARVDGRPAAVAKVTTFDGLTYLSSVGTRSQFRGRGLGSLVTRQAVAVDAGASRRLTYLGVFSGNAPAQRMYARLGFASIGEAPDMLLE
jgi:ribosomal protein S18 acetylase RimI-like enzyme